MPRGGKRTGSGRKPRTALERAVTGDPGHRAKVLPGPGSGQVPVIAPIVGVDPPADLTLAERAVWDSLAPHASALRTLTPATALAFRLLCRNVVLEQALATGEEKGASNHRGILTRVDAELAAFSLRPFGKAIYTEEAEAKPVTPLEKFLKRG